MELTRKQKEVLQAIKTLIGQNGRNPTLNEVREYLGYGAISSVQQHTNALKAKGFLISEQFSRGLKLNKDTYKATVNIPVVGEGSCGKLRLTDQDISAYIAYPAKKLSGEVGEYMFLIATGDSMEKAGIDSGDFLLVKRQPNPEENAIVVALIGDEATVKYFKRKNGMPYLEPASNNPEYKPIYLVNHQNNNISFCGIVKDILKISKAESYAII
ncbi:MAG: transcriptional repressor LexA [Candidatus Paceibacterota bacterium]|jgi:repressor LexA